MPFITRERRKSIDEFRNDMLPLSSGDKCYICYKQMVDQWNANPRWATADEIYRKIRSIQYKHMETRAAHELAWQVFFQLHVIPYELKKLEENGDI